YPSHTLRRPPISSLFPYTTLFRSNAALPTAQQVSTNALRPYKGFTNINFRLSDANSNYHALQLYGTKRKGDLELTAGYTWSKVLTDTSGNGDGLDVGEDPVNRHYT